MTSAQKTGIWIIGIVVVLVIIAALSEQGHQDTPQTTAGTVQQQPQGISMSQVDISNLKLGCAIGGAFPNCGPSGFVLTGEVTNNSETPFQNIYLTVEGYDCPGTSITSDCTHIAETKWADLGVAGGGVEEFTPGLTKEAEAVAVDLSGMPPIQGNFLWSYEITPCSGNNSSLWFDCGFWNGYEILPALP